ncbi:GNAT family N-acetyltransferase [Methyloradius palustris]|uniref:N-acetyltransferase n=1 Tax=Methyloradius palustris TaxID=2778876 RepID=A0A8D5G974_9PROT|nr:GNAT family N-acetyltransferase [Methyloradius palustris]BCM23941.1 N-acetyltransferase [Methyloradius palustris]
MLKFTFRWAVSEEAIAVSNMINDSYRGEQSKLGWTTEAHLLDGLRTTPQEILDLINRVDSIILLCHCESELVGSVHLEKHADTAYLGMFVVRPTLQAQGIGKQLLQAAESEAKVQWGATKSAISVISARDELLQFYERRGYIRTGELNNFPVNPAMWQPKIQNLQLALLEKQLR